MKSAAIMAYSGAVIGIAISWVVPLLLPETSYWAPTAGIVLGLIIILSANDDPDGYTQEPDAGVGKDEDEPAIADKGGSISPVEGGDDTKHNKKNK
jgi:hypothetical protein